MIFGIGKKKFVDDDNEALFIKSYLEESGIEMELEDIKTIIEAQFKYFESIGLIIK